MKIVEQSVTLEGMMVPVCFIDGAVYVSGLTNTPDEGELLPGVSERLIERAGRTAYRSEGLITEDSHKTFMKKVLSVNHLSVTEHSGVTFRAVCDCGVGRELARHRLAAFTQESTRYCNYTKDKFGNEISLSPMQEGLTRAQVERREQLWRRIESVYMAEIDEGVKPQQARDNLPLCLTTEIVMTANLREWRHIMMLRTAKDAHPRMRQLANLMYEILVVIAPEMFQRPLSREEMLLDVVKKFTFDAANDVPCLFCHNVAEIGHHKDCVVGQALGEKVAA